MGKASLCQSSTANLAFSNDPGSSRSRYLQLAGKLKEQGNQADQEFDKHRANKMYFFSPVWREKKNMIHSQNCFLVLDDLHLRRRRAFVEVVIVMLYTIKFRRLIAWESTSWVQEYGLYTAGGCPPKQAWAGTERRLARRAATLECWLCGERRYRLRDPQGRRHALFRSLPFCSDTFFKLGRNGYN